VTEPPARTEGHENGMRHRRPLVGILLFDEVEVLDFAGPFEVFSGTSSPGGDPYVDIVTIGPTRQIDCRGGLRVQVSHLVTDCPPLDALVVPGGPGADDRTAIQDAVLLPFLRDRAKTTPTVASVCTGAFLLARAGLFDGRRATTHTQALPALRAEFPSVDVVGGKIVDDGPVTSAAGVSSGIDLALHLLERWFGPEARARAATGLDGPWT
jgi:transcriptional regulator GlxA family with amidase domain